MRVPPLRSPGVKITLVDFDSPQAGHGNGRTAGYSDEASELADSGPKQSPPTRPTPLNISPTSSPRAERGASGAAAAARAAVLAADDVMHLSSGFQVGRFGIPNSAGTPQHQTVSYTRGVVTREQRRPQQQRLGPTPPSRSRRVAQRTFTVVLHNRAACSF